jgi:excisionase family DNA binding protein
MKKKIISAIEFEGSYDDLFRNSVSVREAAARMKVTKEQVYKLLRRYLLQGQRIRGIWYIDKSSFEQWLKDTGHTFTLSPGWYESNGTRRYVSDIRNTEVRYLTPGGATRYCRVDEFVAWLKFKNE